MAHTRDVQEVPRGWEPDVVRAKVGLDPDYSPEAGRGMSSSSRWRLRGETRVAETLPSLRRTVRGLWGWGRRFVNSGPTGGGHGREEGVVV